MRSHLEVSFFMMLEPALAYYFDPFHIRSAGIPRLPKTAVEFGSVRVKSLLLNLNLFYLFSLGFRVLNAFYLCQITLADAKVQASN